MSLFKKLFCKHELLESNDEVYMQRMIFDNFYKHFFIYGVDSQELDKYLDDIRTQISAIYTLEDFSNFWNITVLAQVFKTSGLSSDIRSQKMLESYSNEMGKLMMLLDVIIDEHNDFTNKLDNVTIRLILRTMLNITQTVDNVGFMINGEFSVIHRYWEIINDWNETRRKNNLRFLHKDLPRDHIDYCLEGLSEWLLETEYLSNDLKRQCKFLNVIISPVKFTIIEPDGSLTCLEHGITLKISSELIKILTNSYFSNVSIKSFIKAMVVNTNDCIDMKKLKTSVNYEDFNKVIPLIPLIRNSVVYKQIMSKKH